MAQCLEYFCSSRRSEIICSFPSIHVRWLTTTLTPAPGCPVPFVPRHWIHPDDPCGPIGLTFLSLIDISDLTNSAYTVTPATLPHCLRGTEKNLVLALRLQLLLLAPLPPDTRLALTEPRLLESFSFPTKPNLFHSLPLALPSMLQELVLCTILEHVTVNYNSACYSSCGCAL